MSRRLALLALAICLVGCSRYRSREPGPFKKLPPPPPGFSQQPGPPPGKSPLAMNVPPPPPLASQSDDRQILPPMPPAGGGSAVVPAGAVAPVNPAEAMIHGSGPAEAAGPSAGLPPTSGTTVPTTPVGGAPGSPSPPSAPQPSPAAVNLAHLKRLTQAAAAKWQAVDTYEARLTRREVIEGKDSKTEEVLFQFRKEPMSVYMRNEGPAGKGREIVYNPSRHGDKLHIVVGEGDSAFLKAGSKAPSMSPDNPKVTSSSRHSIRSAGFGTTITKFATLVGKIETGKLPPDVLRYAGSARCPEFGELPLEAVEQTVRPGEDQLAKGGVRKWYFDADPKSQSFGLPVLVILTDASGREIEYYRFTQVRCPAHLGDADFDPARLGNKR